jgi:hypothetical protein
MPLTTTATWPDLVAGKKAKASEVEQKFDWLEGSLLPHSSGNFTTNAYDLGMSSASWRATWTKSLNPTTTASGVAIGQLAANANTSLDLSAMPKALYMPILTTVQRDALTPSAGMMIYNSTNSRMERYEGGQWLAMNNPYGLVTKIRVAKQTTSYSEVLNITGSGNIKQISLKWDGTDNPTIYGLIDASTTVNTLTTSTNASVVIEGRYTASTFGLYETTASYLPPYHVNAPYKSSAIIYYKSTTGNTASVSLIYEAA